MYISIYLFIVYINLVYTLCCAFEYYVCRICALQNNVIIIIDDISYFDVAFYFDESFSTLMTFSSLM